MSYIDEDEIRKTIRELMAEKGLRVVSGKGEPAAPEDPDDFPRLKGITAAELRHKVFPPRTWIVDEVIPSGLTLLAGKPKVGKSYLMLDLAVAVARGGYVLDRKCVQGDVAYLALEDDEVRLQRRLQQVTTGGEWPARLTLFPNMSPIEKHGLKQLRAWIEEAAEPRLIIIDVFTKVRRVASSREAPYDADYRAAGPLKELADETGVAIVVIHHLRKQTAEDDPLDMVSGTTGLTGAADTIVVLDRKAAGVTLYARGRDIEEIEWAVEFDKQTGRWSNRGDAAEARMTDTRRAIIRALRAEGEPMSPSDIAREAGTGDDNVRRTLSRMAAAGEVVRVKRGQYALPAINPCPNGPNVPNHPSTEGNDED